MPVFDPSHTRTGTWQLPWLRVSLILRTMAADAESPDDDLAELLTMRRELAGQGWLK